MFIRVETINVRDFVDVTLPFLVVQLVLVRYVRSEVHSIHFLYSTIHLHSRQQRCLQTDQAASLYREHACRPKITGMPPLDDVAILLFIETI